MHVHFGAGPIDLEVAKILDGIIRVVRAGEEPMPLVVDVSGSESATVSVQLAVEVAHPIQGTCNRAVCLWTWLESVFPQKFYRSFSPNLWGLLLVCIGRPPRMDLVSFAYCFAAPSHVRARCVGRAVACLALRCPFLLPACAR